MASENAAMRRRIALGIVSLAAAAALVVPWSQASAAPSTLTVASGVVEAGQIASVAITLNDAPVSVAGFDLIVTLTDPTVAEIVGASFPEFGLTRQVLNSGSEIRIRAVDLVGLIEAGATNALLANVNILGVRTGGSDVNVQVIRMDDDDGFPMNPQALSGTLTVLNVTPKVDSGPDVTVQKRDAFSGSGSFTDSEGDTWTATVDYGDGSSVQPLPLNGASFSLSHIYADAGVYTVTVTVTDAVSAAGTDVLVVEVTYPTLPGMDAPARDLDGDGRAEDVNGNGRLDFADVWAAFVYMDSPEVQANSSDFDYNGDGLANIADIRDLFEMISSVRASVPTAQTSSMGVGSLWQLVTLPNAYSSMVVVCSANYGPSDLPAVVRVRNASGNSFEIKVQNPGASALSGYTVHCVAVEEGVYTEAAEGVKMEAVRFNSTITDRKGSWSGQNNAYTNSYTSPVVVGQVMTANDPDWSSFWASNGSQTSPPSSSALFVGKHVGEDPDTTRLSETIGYIVIEAGTGAMDGVPYTAAVGPDTVQGFSNFPPYSYSLSGLSSAAAVVVSSAGMDGGDGGWPLLFGSTAATATSLNLAVDEDQLGDSERSHTTEQVAYIVFE